MAEPLYSLSGKRVYVAGHRGMVGSAICRALEGRDCTLLTAPRAELDLMRQGEVEAWFQEHKPDAVFLAAAKVGGILANDTRPADFLVDNLLIETNIIKAAFENGVGKLMFLGSSCIYPKLAPQPMAEDALLTEFAQLRLLFRTHRQIMRTRIRRMLTESRLMTATLISFLIIDYLGLSYLVKPVFDRDIGHLLAEEIRIGPAFASQPTTTSCTSGLRRALRSSMYLRTTSRSRNSFLKPFYE